MAAATAPEGKEVPPFAGNILNIDTIALWSLISDHSQIKGTVLPDTSTLNVLLGDPVPVDEVAMTIDTIFRIHVNPFGHISFQQIVKWIATVEDDIRLV